MRDRTFAVMWDCHGLEAIACVSDIHHQITLETLKNGKVPKHIQGPNLMHWQLRARYNSQRHYEIYIFSATDGITTEDIRQMFDSQPQYAADLIRKNGHCVYSDRSDQSRMKIV